jgi:hypothetical protein
MYTVSTVVLRIHTDSNTNSKQYNWANLFSFRSLKIPHRQTSHAGRASPPARSTFPAFTAVRGTLPHANPISNLTSNPKPHPHTNPNPNPNPHPYPNPHPQQELPIGSEGSSDGMCADSMVVARRIFDQIQTMCEAALR